MLTYLSWIIFYFTYYSPLPVMVSRDIEVIVEDSIQLDTDEIEVYFYYQLNEKPEKFLKFIDKNNIKIEKLGRDSTGQQYKVIIRQQHIKEFAEVLWKSDLNNYYARGKSNQSEEAERLLSKKVVEDAKIEAGIIAEKSGLKITSVLNIEDLPLGGWRAYPPRSAYSNSEELPKEFRFEKITLKKKVKVKFKAE